MYIDLHTHSLLLQDKDSVSIVNSSNPATADNTLFSAGLHPWNITAGWEKEFAGIKEIATHPQVVAIGECGIDKVKSTAGTATQEEALAAHALLAEEVKKPLILHCVKGTEEIIALHRNMHPQQAWIIHGFRGKPELAAQFLREGLYLSYGEKFNSNSLKATPLNRLFIESDTSSTPIKDIYTAIAVERGTTIEELAEAIQNNATVCNIAVNRARQV